MLTRMSTASRLRYKQTRADRNAPHRPADTACLLVRTGPPGWDVERLGEHWQRSTA